MNPELYTPIKLTAGVLATIGLYCVLYRENKFYRFFEHAFLGLASGWALVALWTEALREKWWDKMVGSGADAAAGNPGAPGYWAYIMLLPIGLLGYFVFSKKHNWLSRIPIGIILGLWSGQQIQIWWRTYGPQIDSSLLPILPTTTESFIVPSTRNLTPEQTAAIVAQVYPSEAISNLLFVLTLICVLSYFLFSFDVKNRVLRNATTMGRYLLMIGFGAIFGSTVMMRFTLLIDRMYFIFDQWLKSIGVG